MRKWPEVQALPRCLGRDVDTNQLIADATVALAVVGGLAFIANVLIAWFTLKAARATRRSAEATEKAAEATLRSAMATETAAAATRDEADATRDEAAATKQTVAEIQIDRDLNWRPYPVIDHTSWSANVRGGTDKVWLKNIGRGPAFNTVCARLYYLTVDRAVANQVPQWRLSIELPQTIESDGVKEFSLQDPTNAAAVPLVLFDVIADPQPTFSTFYQDIVGKRAYRLTYPRAAPDVWNPGDKVEPWVSWYFGHLHLQVPQ